MPVYISFLSCAGYMRHQLFARDLTGAQARQVRRILLAIDDANAMTQTDADERGECRLRCVCAVGEHRFSEDGVAQCDAIQPACQLSIDPSLHAVC